MSTGTTLFAHIASNKLKGQIEDTAVEALNYILSNSPAAKNALENILREGCPEFNSISRVETWETGKKGEIPDLVCYDNEDIKHVLIEAKFWAEMTKNQPNQYLMQLQEEKKGESGVLLFVAPKVRLESLWAELCWRAENREPSFQLITPSESLEVRVASTSDRELRLLLTSWSALLDRMETQALKAGEQAAAADIRQLRGLTELAEPVPFVLWSPEELGPAFALRMEGLRRLVDDATSLGKNASFLYPKKIAKGGAGGYGRAIRLGGMDAWFGVEVLSWAQSHNTPLWLRLDGDVHGQLSGTELAKEMFQPGTGWSPRVPIELPAWVNYDEVLNSVVNRLQSIALQLEPNSDANAVVDPNTKQLRGLANRMDAYAFMPWRLEELEPKYANRLVGMHGIIDETISYGRSAGYVQWAKVVPRLEGYGCSIRINGVKAWLGIHIGAWAQHGNTPLWLSFDYHERPRLEKVTPAAHEVDWKPCIPISIPATAEHDEMLDTVVCNLKNIADQLKASNI